VVRGFAWVGFSARGRKDKAPSKAVSRIAAIPGAYLPMFVRRRRQAPRAGRDILSNGYGYGWKHERAGTAHTHVAVS